MYNLTKSLDEIRRTFDVIQARWRQGTPRAQVLLDIDTLESLLGRLEDLPGTAQVEMLWRQSNYIQGEMRLQSHRETHRNVDMNFRR